MTLEKVVFSLKSLQQPATSTLPLIKTNTGIQLVITVAFLVSMLSLPLEMPARIIWYAIYPVIMAPLSGITYSSVFRKSLLVLPIVIIIGVFNPFYDHRTAFVTNGIEVSMGWITFLSIILRGLLSMQALIILIRVAGLRKICEALGKLGCPKVLTVQLMMLYRFMGSLLEEALIMKRSVVARGFGKKSFPLKIWSQLLGSLLLRSIENSKHIHNAMLARGFNGNFYMEGTNRLNVSDLVFCGVWMILFVILRFFDLSQLMIENGV